MSTFRKRLREFAAEEIAKPGEHKRQEIADQFLDDNPELAAEYVRELAAKKVAELIKEMCDEPEDDPLPIFNGFPRAITIAPGVVKASEHCTLDDFGAGLDPRLKNIKDAQRRLESYKDSMALFETLRSGAAETLGQCSKRLRAQAEAERDSS